MQTPLQISFRNMEPSDLIAARVRERGKRLGKFFDRIIGCRVVVETPHRGAAGAKNAVGICIEVTVPGKEFVVRRAQQQHAAHDDSHRVIRDAFEAVERQLEEHARLLRRKH